MKLKAVINIGANSISLTLAEVGSKDIRIIESLEQPSFVGQDSFTEGVIRNETINAAITTLKGYLRLLKEYNVDLKDVKVIASGAVRDAENTDTFLDRISVATKLTVRVLEPSEVNKITYSILRPYLEQIKQNPNSLLLALHVGREDTELIGIKNGQVEFANLFRFGTTRIKAEISETADPTLQMEPQIIAGFEKSMYRVTEHLLGLKKVTLLLLGDEVRFVAARLGYANLHECVKIQARSVNKILKAVMETAPQDLAAKYNLALGEAENLAPALYIITRLMEELRLRTVWICPVNFRDGIFMENEQKPLRLAMDTQTIGSAWRILAHYNSDHEHARSVLTLSKAIFKATQKLHGLSGNSRLLLEVAAIMHDAGAFVSHHAHHKHSAYIIENSDIFGLTARQQTIVAQLARYHRRALPQIGHEVYNNLTRKEKTQVNKLAAILRVADSLDNSHGNLLREAKVFVKNDVLYIQHPNVIYATGEMVSLSRKKDLFQQVFGMDVKLIQ